MQNSQKYFSIEINWYTVFCPVSEPIMELLHVFCLVGLWVLPSPTTKAVSFYT